MHPATNRFLLTFVFGVPAVMMGLAASPVDDRDPRSVRALQDMVDVVKAQLGIEAAVTAAVVPDNPLLVSVQPVNAASANAFVMSFDERFLTELDEDDLRAIVAHELGHVWIFTHHPYLQTERLANSVAMRAVSRASLERVYAKVWGRDGSKGDFVRFLGQ
jgi:hypothetical protein